MRPYDLLVEKDSRQNLHGQRGRLRMMRIIAVCLWALCLCVVPVSFAVGAESRLEHGLPRDTLFYAHIPSAEAWMNDLEHTPLGAVLRHPDVQLFGQLLWEDRQALLLYLGGGAVPDAGLESTHMAHMLQLVELLRGDVTVAATGRDATTDRVDLAAAITFSEVKDPVELLSRIGSVMPGWLVPVDDSGGMFFRVGGKRGLFVAFRPEGVIMATRREALERLWRAYAETVQDADCLARESLFRQARNRVDARGNRLFIYGNMNTFRNMLLTANLRDVVHQLNISGLGSVDAIAFGGGSTSDGAVQHSLYLSAPEPRAGWLAQIREGGDLARSVAAIPADTDILLATVLRPDISERGMGAFFARDGEHTPWELFFKNLTGPEGEAVSEVLLPALSSEMVFFSTGAGRPPRLIPSDGVFRWNVRNAAGLERGLEVLRRTLGEENWRTVGENPVIHYCNRFDRPRPFCVAYAVEGDTWHLSFSTQTLRAFFDEKKSSGKRNARFWKEAVRACGWEPNVALLRLDTKTSFRHIYDACAGMSHMLTAIPGVGADGAILPPFDDIDTSWGDTVAGVRVDRDGLLVRVSGPVGLLGLPAWVGGHMMASGSGSRNVLPGIVMGVLFSRAAVELQESLDTRSVRQRLRHIGMAIAQWQQRTGESFPRSLDVLVEEGVLARDDLQLSRRGMVSSFDLGDGSVVLVHERLLPGVDRVLALFADGSVSFVPSERIRAWQTTGKIP